MFRYLTRASLLALAAAGMAKADDHAHDGDVTQYRVFVGDHDRPEVTAVDLTAPEKIWRFATTGQAKLFAIAGGQVVALVQSDDDKVQFLASGITLQDHGDHADITVGDPAALMGDLTGPRPFHLVEHGGKVVINYDKGGYAGVLDAAAVVTGDLAEVKFPQSRAHHGFVAPLGASWLSTVASDAVVEGDASVPRLGLRAFDLAGLAQGDLATCTGIHGEAFSGDYLAAGCKEGVLTARDGATGPEYAMLPYPDEFPQDLTTGTLLGGSGIQLFLGNHGPKGLVVIDPAEAPHFQRIDLPFRRVDFVLDPAKPGTGYVLTEDGSLHRIDLLAARLDASAKVTAPYSMEGHWNDPRPRLAMAGGQIVVSDPLAGVLRLISTTDLREERVIEIGGKPYNLTVVGGSGISH